MKNLNQVIAGLSLFLIMGVPITYASPVLNLDNGHYYELIDLEGTWGQYNAAANSSSYNGLQGHLATVTSASENTWLVSTFSATSLNKHLFGGTDQVTEGVWEWVTGEAWDYSNWARNEPNDYLGNENYVEFWHNNGSWNDIWFDRTSQGRRSHKGYIIEYENVASVSAVPVPGAVWLFATGLIGFVGMRQKS